MTDNIATNKKIIHHAFSVTYGGIVRELLTDVEITHPSALIPDLKDKNFSKFKAVWDTGATNTVITKKIVEALELVPTGKAEMFSVNKKSTVDTYIIDIGLPNKVLLRDVNVICGEINNIDVLIGMDIIQSGDFSISNAKGKTHFSYCLPPHKNPVCLVEKSNKINAKKK